MSSSAARIEYEPRAIEVRCTTDALVIGLADGREISAPLEWFPRLRDASTDARADWRLIGGGVGFHLTQLDEDISVAGLLATH